MAVSNITDDTRSKTNTLGLVVATANVVTTAVIAVPKLWLAGKSKRLIAKLVHVSIQVPNDDV